MYLGHIIQHRWAADNLIASVNNAELINCKQVVNFSGLLALNFTADASGLL